MTAAAGQRPESADPVPLLVRLYPAAWRSRYGDEFAELLASRPPGIRDRLDIMLGAADARLHSQVDGTPAQRVVTAADRSLAFAAVVVGALFSFWAGVIVVFSHRWGEGATVVGDLLALSYGAGLVGAVIAITFLLGLIYRHIDDLRSIGTLGALVMAAGFLAMTGDAGATAIPLIVIGTVGMSPGLARAVGRPVTALLLGSTLLLASAMFGFVGSGGQELLWLSMLAGYGPSWVLLGISLRRGARVASPALVGA